MILMFKSIVKNERGQAMVEMAIVIILLMMLIFGITEFGRIFYSNLAVSNGARTGARHAAVTDLTDDALKLFIAQRTFPGSETIFTNADPDDGDITIVYTDLLGNDARGLGGTISVKVDYPVPIYAPIISRFTGNPRWVSSTVVMRIETEDV